MYVCGGESGAIRICFCEGSVSVRGGAMGASGLTGSGHLIWPCGPPSPQGEGFAKQNATVNTLKEPFLKIHSSISSGRRLLGWTSRVLVVHVNGQYVCGGRGRNNTALFHTRFGIQREMPDGDIGLTIEVSGGQKRRQPPCIKGVVGGYRKEPPMFLATVSAIQPSREGSSAIALCPCGDFLTPIALHAIISFLFHSKEVTSWTVSSS